MRNATAPRHQFGSAARTTARYGYWVALSLLGLVAGCTQQQQQQVEQGIVGGGTTQVAGVLPVDGFLPQPQLLTRGAPGQAELVYYTPGVSLSTYGAILLDPVTIVSDAQGALATASPAQRETLANLYYSELYAALSPHCRMVSRPAPGVLRFTVALTDATTSNGVIKTLATYTPYVATAYKAGMVAFNDRAGYFSGTATSEAYATDAVSNVVVWEGADRRAGTTALLQNTTNSWDDVDNAMKAWGQFAVKRLRDLGVCTN